ncbi:site-specific DNA-methyltransferase [Candidatus Thiothrix anitrata]|uniref:site-specific DNA-methyltransferase (adenine-specific) n=1 Tax=Candidatus Thiothrix anitrata TaxID=2823902 RepID=A0ABX7X2Z2_9GAMM|nr:site-specific DNA-methyltransferase [Candidatus Thiothrix anitrata]QTR48978.1 site-specific DNA-methyltransferase [Candidatus Thiothrix anitrata]
MHKLTAHDAETQSLDLVADNIAKLTALFPEILTEGADGGKRVDFEALRELLGTAVEDKEERYNFTWHGKAQARRLAQTPSTGTLRPCPAESKHWDSTQNLFIEGDNLEVLKLLQKSYHQRVKMIYIDPPYNTGKDFIYPDNYRDNIANYLELTGQTGEDGRKLAANPETSGRYHTHWLNMMYPRLKLARNLLRDDGVIFISIDDTEVANLRKLCDEIFGEENFIASIIWQKRTSPDMRTTFSEGHEYIVMFSKKQEATLSFNKLPITDEQRARYKNPDNDPRGVWVSSDFTAQGYRPNQMYKIVTPGGATYDPPDGKCWKNIEAVFLQQVQDGRFWFGSDGNGVPRRKNYLNETDGRIPWTWWTNQEVGHSQEAKQEVNQIFDQAEVFSTPKPVRLIERMLQITTFEDSVILDFFSGSAATAHAVMALNAEDGGNRKFIMVQLPEPTDKPDYPTIADIGKERIRRAGEKILTDKGGIINLDVGFKVFKLDSTNIKPWDVGFDDLETSLPLFADSLKDDRSNDDVLYEILLKYGLDLSLPITTHTLAGKTVYSIGMGALVVCLDKAITLDTVEGIAKLKDELQPEDSLMRVVFRDSGFADDVVKVNAVQILKQAGIEDVRSV